MQSRLIILFVLAISSTGVSQNFNQQLEQLYTELKTLQDQQQVVEGKIETVKLASIRDRLSRFGLPAISAGEEIIYHEALALVYNEQHEQAKWVAHIITSDIIKGNVFRTNDFREDPKVSSGSATEKDYFLKTLKPDSTFEYDGFGYDRGHLAPSADFRWSKKALSESYFYSNMSPQLPEFNREVWASLENALRGYIFRNPEAELMVVTGPLINNTASFIERSVHKVSIPVGFWKVALDLKNRRGIGFYMTHEGHEEALSTFALTIDEIEQLVGLNFFHMLEDNLEDQLEKQRDLKAWFPDLIKDEVDPVDPSSLPPNHFNTVQALRYMDKNESVIICGTAVSTRLSRAGNALINFDKQFPNQIFTLFIRKQNLINFSYDPVQFLKNKQLCVEGKVVGLGGVPAVFLEKQEKLEVK